MVKVINESEQKYDYVGEFSDEAKENFLKFLDELHEKEISCSVVSHTNHSNHNNW